MWDFSLHTPGGSWGGGGSRVPPLSERVTATTSSVLGHRGQQRHGSTVASCPAHFQLSLLLETSRGHPTFGPNQPKTPTFSKSSLPQTSPRRQTHKQGRPLALLCLFCPSFQLSPSDRSLMSPRMSPLTEGQCRIIQVLAPLPPGSSPPCPSARSTRPRGMLCPEIKSQKFQKSNSRNYRNPAS